MATNEKYVALPINGEVVQTNSDTILDFTTNKGQVIRVAVAPMPMSERPPTGFFRSTTGTDALMYIVPAGSVWIDDVESQKIIAIAFSDSPRLMVPLYPALDIRKDMKGRVVKTNHSPILYRAVDPDTGATAKSFVITEVTVSSAADVVEQPA